jgi:hypothetical protein
MREQNTQMDALVAALAQAGFVASPDFKGGSIALTRLPEFKDDLVFSLVITMDDPFAKEWGSLMDGCAIASGRILKGGAHTAGIYSRRKATERAKQEKWAAVWSLYDAGIMNDRPGPEYDRWEDIVLP